MVAGQDYSGKNRSKFALLVSLVGRLVTRSKFFEGNFRKIFRLKVPKMALFGQKKGRSKGCVVFLHGQGQFENWSYSCKTRSAPAPRPFSAFCRGAEKRLRQRPFFRFLFRIKNHINAIFGPKICRKISANFRDGRETTCRRPFFAVAGAAVAKKGSNFRVFRFFAGQNVARGWNS